MKKHLGVLGLTAILATPVMAADMRMPVKAPAAPAATVFSWTGCYIGAQGGWGFGKSKGTLTNVAGLFPTPYDLDITGGIAGGHLGCQLQSGGWVIGLEGDGEWSDLSDSGIFSLTPFSGRFDIGTKVKAMGSVRGRFGWAADRWLFYVTAGWAIASVETHYAVVGLPPFHTEDTTRNGWTVGGGIQWAFAPSWSARAEYRYTDLGKKRFVEPTVNSADAGNEIAFSAVRIGVSYHFGGPVAERY
jgi:outer membrane immunogenic protein